MRMTRLEFFKLFRGLISQSIADSRLVEIIKAAVKGGT
jgi:hypothetical protein